MKISIKSLPVAFLFISGVVFSNQYDPRYASVTCAPNEAKDKIDCDYRYAPTLDVSSLSLTVDGTVTQIPEKGVSAYPAPNQKTAILILVDTSDPARKNTVENKNVNALVEILAARKPYQEIGIATFDTELTVLAPISANEAEALSAVKNIKATGQTTEFYKNVLAAIDILKSKSASRKGLIIISDGKDEDRAYKKEDVIKAAQDSGVQVLGLGYAERPSDVPYLQTLKRLSDETYGEFIGVQEKLPASLTANPFAFAEKGGRVTFNSDLAHGQTNVGIAYVLKDGKSIEIETITDFPDNRSIFNKFYDCVVKYWMYLILGVVILALLIFLFYKIIERRKLDFPKVIEYAYLIEPDGLGSRHVISSTAVRIGRSQSNDICLQNNSISFHHAEIHRRRDGTFYIVDLGSTNGVMVNQEQVTQVEIKDGDVIELGEVRLNFYTN